MKLVFLYGPPAVGKLTVARALSKITGYPVFHNHHSVDVLKDVFVFHSKPFQELNEAIRLMVYERTAKEHMPGLITTVVYDSKTDKPYLKKVLHSVEKHGGKVCWVHLTASANVLFSRVSRKSRSKHGKIKSVQKLRGLLKQYDMFSAAPFSHSLSINTAQLRPNQSAQKIVRHFALA